MWLMKSFDLQLDGSHDGEPFTALRAGPGGTMPLYASVEYAAGLNSGVVMVPLAHPVPGEVWFARGRATLPGNVHTEWLDFDDDFEVRSADQRVAHEVTTPKLMEYLYDHRVRRFTVSGEWAFAGIRPFDPEHIAPMVSVLAGARDLLPGYRIEQR